MGNRAHRPSQRRPAVLSDWPRKRGREDQEAHRFAQAIGDYVANLSAAAARRAACHGLRRHARARRRHRLPPRDNAGRRRQPRDQALRPRRARSMPESSVDPVVMAAATVQRGQTIVSREIAATQPAVDDRLDPVGHEGQRDPRRRAAEAQRPHVRPGRPRSADPLRTVSHGVHVREELALREQPGLVIGTAFLGASRLVVVDVHPRHAAEPFVALLDRSRRRRRLRSAAARKPHRVDAMPVRRGGVCAQHATGPSAGPIARGTREPSYHRISAAAERCVVSQDLARRGFFGR